jgi:hypothetical protein
MYNDISDHFNKTSIIFNDVFKIINTNIFELKNYKLDLSLHSDSFIILINNLVNTVLSSTNTVKSYKYSYYEPLIEFIINIIIKKNIDLSYANYNILKIINGVNNAHIYLKKIKGYIIDNKYININLLFSAANKGTLPNFLFWWMIFKNDVLSHDDYLQLISLSITNCDDRIFKYIIDINIGNFYSNANFECVLVELLRSNIPKKFKLKRIKLLSTKKNLSIYYNVMIQHSYSLSLINCLSKFYYNQILTFDIIKNIFINNNDNFDFILALQLYNNLKTIKEKNCFTILCNLNGYNHEKIKYFNNDYEILNSNYIYIISQITRWLDSEPGYISNNKLLNNIFKYYIQNNYINLFMENEYSEYTSLYKYTRFYVDQNKFNIYNIKINKVLHFIRCVMKKKYRIKEQYFKLNFKPIINEIINFKPNLKCPILKQGSINYQLKEQEFNNIPPRHLLPLETIIDKIFLIKEKADGILTKNIPKHIHPEVLEIFEHEIKAEFIEELNLYLVFDINIPNKTIYERQVYLRNLHYITSSKKIVPNINNIDQLINEINDERQLINTFINTNMSEIKWYPKGSWKINMTTGNYKQLIQIISEESRYLNFILHGPFNCDGLILTPLDGSRELKVKPYHLQTIDLLYDSNKWLDKEKNNYNIIKNPNKKYKNKIYRCYPIIDSDNQLKYIPKEIRYDKRHPNSFQIIDQIQNIYKFNWNTTNLLINSKKYYENKIKINDNQIISIINKNKQILESMIKFIKPETNKKWLDLGCGNCKLFKYIKDNYYPKKYLGIDNDIDILSQSYYLVDQYSDVFNIYPSDLNLQWDRYNIWNTFNWTIKYEYVIANFSLMHFCNDTFWTQLNNITMKGSKFIFNLVKENSVWFNDKSYLRSNSEYTEINFEWTHLNKFTEPLINDILNYITKFNWKMIHTYETTGPLTDCYKWYIIERL